MLYPKTQVAKTAEYSAHTICQRQIDYGIVISRPSHSQTQQVVGDNGGPPHSGAIGDDKLNHYLAIIIQDFPSFGHRLATVALQANGVMVSEGHVQDSLAWIRGVPGIFGGQRVHCQWYHVAGANSLWHHDGQHYKSPLS